MVKKGVSMVMAALVLFLCLAGCGLTKPQLIDYDISGYIKAMLDSSYRGSHEAYMDFAKYTNEQAEQNRQVTVENGAVHFCNSFGIYPTDEQMLEIEAFISEAYKLSKYTVQKEVKTETGYSVEIEIQPLTLFSSLKGEFEALRQSAQDGNLSMPGTTPQPESTTAPESSEGEEDWTQDWEEDSSSEVSPTPPPTPQVDVNTVFVAHVIERCKKAVSQTSPSYAPAQTISMVILLDDEGVLSMDIMQVQEIDETVIAFS